MELTIWKGLGLTSCSQNLSFSDIAETPFNRAGKFMLTVLIILLFKHVQTQSTHLDITSLF